MGESAASPRPRPAATSASDGEAEQLHQQIGTAAPGEPSRLRTGALVAWLKLGSCTDQVASATASRIADRDQQRTAADLADAPAHARAQSSDRKVRLSRLRSIADMAALPQPSTATRRCNASAVVSWSCTMATRI